MLNNWTPDKEANRELEALAAVFMDGCRDWLKKHEPAYLEQMGDQVTVWTALQGLGNAEVARVEAMAQPDHGTAWINGLGHQLALFVLQQSLSPSIVWSRITGLVNDKLQELLKDQVGNHMVGAALPTKGTA